MADITPLPTRSGVSEDAWATDDGGYSETRFFTRSTDGHGHREEVRVRVPPHIHGRMTALVQSGAIPAYKTYGDIARDALVHRMHWLSEHANDPELRASLSAYLALHMMDVRVAEARDMHQRVNHLREQIRELGDEALRNDDAEGLIIELEWLVGQAMVLREPFRGQLLTLIRSYQQRAADGR